MLEFINHMTITPLNAMGYYLLAGVLLFHDMKRIRWYAMSLYGLVLAPLTGDS